MRIRRPPDAALSHGPVLARRLATAQDRLARGRFVKVSLRVIKRRRQSNNGRFPHYIVAIHRKKGTHPPASKQ
eukprot:7206997-Ditylum_brightwellii.AAC.1